MGGDKMPPDIWLELCRVPEERSDFKRALSEYEKLAAAYPADAAGPHGTAWCRSNPAHAIGSSGRSIEIVRGGVGLRRSTFRFGIGHRMGHPGS